MKRRIALGVIATALAGCGGGAGTTTNEPGNTFSANPTQTVTHSPSTRLRKRRARRSGIPAGYYGLGVPKSLYVKKNEQAPPNPAGAPAGLAWYTVTSTGRRGRVTAVQMTENFQPNAGDRERVTLMLGIGVPADSQETNLNNDRCLVIQSNTLKRLTGFGYAAATTVTGTRTAGIRAESTPAC